MSATPYVGNDVFMKVHEMAICKICGAIDNELPAKLYENRCQLAAFRRKNIPKKTLFLAFNATSLKKLMAKCTCRFKNRVAYPPFKGVGGGVY